MFSLLRGSGLLSLALLLATPGVAGTILQAAHPCPAQAPWLPRSGDAPNAHHHGHGSQQDAPSQCHCIGTCHTAATWAPPAGGPVVPLVQVERVALSNPSATALAPVVLPYRFLPPATAPPIA